MENGQVKRVALITGITGQDGSYLAELLLEKGYTVHGIIRRSSLFNTARIMHLFDEPQDSARRLTLHYGDLTDGSTLARLLRTIEPTEVYNLAAQSHVRVSFDMPTYTGNVGGLGTLRLLEAIRETGVPARFYQASSSEMFGSAPPPQSESTAFHPRSPYAAAKLYAHWITVNYREAYGLHTASGILFNHESPRRGETFVTRKITRGIAQILAGERQHIFLGNLDAKRDWGYAADYVEGMWRMLQGDSPDDYVLATGETHSVREFLELCCRLVDLDFEDVYRTDPRYFRPTEVDALLGDASKAREQLGWEPTVTFERLTRLMLAADIEAVGLTAADYGLEAPREKAVIIGESE